MSVRDGFIVGVFQSIITEYLFRSGPAGWIVDGDEDGSVTDAGWDESRISQSSIATESVGR